jgi:hypothetical protein
MAKPYRVKRPHMVAHIIGETHTGEKFKDWPPHITLYPWFESTEASALDRYMKALAVIERFKIDRTPHRYGELVHFGPEANIPARPIQPNSIGLGFIHGVLAASFADFGVDGTYIGGAFNPHKSEVGGVSNDLSDQGVVVASMCLVVKIGKTKRVVAADRLNQAE